MSIEYSYVLNEEVVYNANVSAGYKKMGISMVHSLLETLNIVVKVHKLQEMLKVSSYFVPYLKTCNVSQVN